MLDWRPIQGFEGFYEVSSVGQVKRILGGPGVRAGRILKLSWSKRAYWQVTLRRPGIKQTRRVHQLVAVAFIGPCPDGKEVNHIDSDPRNTAATNLEYLTHRDNVLHSFRHGFRKPAIPPHPRGERNPASKLTESNVRMIRQSSLSNVALGRQFGVSDVNISLIRRGRKWGHVE